MNSDYRNEYKNIVDHGHAIALHTYSHDFYDIYASEDDYFDDLDRISDLVYEKTGVRSMLIRFPGGSSNTISANVRYGIMSDLVDSVRDRGYQYFDWNASTSDSTTDDIGELLEHAKRYVDNWPFIMLLHHPENEKSSLEAVESLILWGIEENYVFKVLEPDSPGAWHNIAN